MTHRSAHPGSRTDLRPIQGGTGVHHRDRPHHIRDVIDDFLATIEPTPRPGAVPEAARSVPKPPAAVYTFGFLPDEAA